MHSDKLKVKKKFDEGYKELSVLLKFGSAWKFYKEKNLYKLV